MDQNAIHMVAAGSQAYEYESGGSIADSAGARIQEITQVTGASSISTEMPTVVSLAEYGDRQAPVRKADSSRE